MNVPVKNNLDPIEENRRLDIQLAAILSENSSVHQKELQLKELEKTVSTPLAFSHISYYQKNLHEKKRSLYARIAVTPFLLIYVACLLYRTCFFLFPEKDLQDFHLPITDTEFTVLVCFLPILLLGIHLFQQMVLQHISFPHIPYRSYIQYIKQAVIIFYVMFIFLSAIYQLYAHILHSQSAHSLQSYVGSWESTSLHRFWLTIEEENDTYCSIQVYLAPNHSETYSWDMTGIYDAEENCITYSSGDLIHSIYNEDCTTTKEFEYTDGSGSFYIKEDQYLYWNDSKNDDEGYHLFQKTED